MQHERSGPQPHSRRAFLTTSVAGAATVGAVAQAAPASPSGKNQTAAAAVFANNVGSRSPFLRTEKLRYPVRR
ncbi:hypothetical protein [Streptomyces sp. NPDC056817]|uniref:hypothetical protein n=1 Tax=unclassified Streptomyces TaxID=2593676 RepID=UPI00368AD75F